ncbi:hypothetical protein M885DRAFT_610135, partial [Pelagophyceae sp. CCMP2097]
APSVVGGGAAARVITLWRIRAARRHDAGTLARALVGLLEKVRSIVYTLCEVRRKLQAWPHGDRGAVPAAVVCGEDAAGQQEFARRQRLRDEDITKYEDIPNGDTDDRPPLPARIHRRAHQGDGAHARRDRTPVVEARADGRHHVHGRADFGHRL